MAGITKLPPKGSWTNAQLQTVRFGPDSIEGLYEVLLEVLGQGSKPKALIVTGRSLSETPVIPHIEDLLKAKDAYVGTFTSIRQHTPREDVDSLIHTVRRKGANVAVAIGGGSPIDACKTLSYFHNEQYGGFFIHVAVPTTLSAAECTALAGHTNKEGNKIGVAADAICPKAIIYDPKLTLHTPEKLWLSTGIRALDHAVENLYRPGACPPMSQMAVSALRDLFSYLPQSKADSQNITARGHLQIAAWMSLYPSKLQTALGPSHALGHSLGATYAIPHGICSVLTLPNTVRVMAKALPEGPERAMLANAFSYIPTSFVRDHLGFDDDIDDEVNAALTLAKALETLNERLGLTTSLSHYNVPKEDLAKLAKASYEACAGKPGWELLLPSAEILQKEVLERIY